VAADVVGSATASGNNSVALALATQVANEATKHQLSFTVEGTLLPAQAGMVVTPKARKAYSKQVVSAELRVKIGDVASLGKWTSSPAKSRNAYVAALLHALKGLFPKAQRSVTMVSPTDTVIATADAGPNGAGTIKLK
jgi:hypothetical protein